MWTWTYRHVSSWCEHEHTGMLLAGLKLCIHRHAVSWPETERTGMLLAVRKLNVPACCYLAGNWMCGIVVNCLETLYQYVLSKVEVRTILLLIEWNLYQHVFNSLESPYQHTDNQLDIVLPVVYRLKPSLWKFAVWKVFIITSLISKVLSSCCWPSEKSRQRVNGSLNSLEMH